jgi:hypothetical protein
MTEWRNAESICLQFILGEHPQTTAVLLLDRQADRLLTRFRRDWAGFDEFELEIVPASERTLQEGRGIGRFRAHPIPP